MIISRDEAIRSATLFVERQGWREWWSLKRLAAHETEHPELGEVCWCVQSVNGAIGGPITMVWLDRETGDPISASRISCAGLEEWPG